MKKSNKLEKMTKKACASAYSIAVNAGVETTWGLYNFFRIKDDPDAVYQFGGGWWTDGRGIWTRGQWGSSEAIAMWHKFKGEDILIIDGSLGMGMGRAFGQRKEVIVRIGIQKMINTLGLSYKVYTTSAEIWRNVIPNFMRYKDDKEYELLDITDDYSKYSALGYFDETVGNESKWVGTSEEIPRGCSITYKGDFSRDDVPDDLKKKYPGRKLVSRAITLHRSGGLLIKVKDRTITEQGLVEKYNYWLSGVDEGSFYLCQLYKKAVSMETAFEVLKPKEARGDIEYKRQGEWFFIDTGLTEKDLRQKYYAEIPKTRFAKEIKYLPLPKKNELSNSHKCKHIKIGNTLYATGEVRHPQHATLVLGDTFHEVYINTSLRDYSLDGNKVD